MFDVGFWEMSLIALIALVILGPERLPKLARTLGLWVGRARRMMSDVKADIDREVRNAELKELSEIKDTVQNAGQKAKDAAADMTPDFKADGLDIAESIQDVAKDVTGGEKKTNG